MSRKNYQEKCLGKNEPKVFPQKTRKSFRKQEKSPGARSLGTFVPKSCKRNLGKFVGKFSLEDINLGKNDCS